MTIAENMFLGNEQGKKMAIDWTKTYGRAEELMKKVGYSLWFVRIPLSWILAKPFGLTGVWIAMCLELICRGILMLIRLLKKL